MRQHLAMPLLSDRERKLIGEFLREADLQGEGDRGLWFMAKKFVMTTYWFHISCFEGRSAQFTVWNMLNRVYLNENNKSQRARPSGSIETALTYEIACVTPWDYIDDDDPLWDGQYRNMNIRTLLDKSPTSMKQFYDELKEMINDGKKNDDYYKQIGIKLLAPAIDTPI